MLIHMASKALSKMDWSALYEHLAKLRGDLETVKRRTPVPMKRFRELRQQISECMAEIGRYHQRAAQEQAPPKEV